MEINLKKNWYIISDKDSREIINKEIKKVLEKHQRCIIDFQQIKSMATYNAKQIFGSLYLELGSEIFFERIEIKNATNDLKLIIRLGIQSAIDDTDVSE